MQAHTALIDLTLFGYVSPDYSKVIDYKEGERGHLRFGLSGRVGESCSSKLL